MSAFVAVPESRELVAFSYDGLEPEVAEAARAAANAVRSLHRRSNAEVAEIGQHLITAKSALPHGRFAAWAETELGIDPRTAKIHERRQVAPVIAKSVQLREEIVVRTERTEHVETVRDTVRQNEVEIVDANVRRPARART